jgi:hypothetical protein
MRLDARYDEIPEWIVWDSKLVDKDTRGIIPLVFMADDKTGEIMRFKPGFQNLDEDPYDNAICEVRNIEFIHN